MLLRFSRTEAGGAVDIARAANAIVRPELKGHLVRHTADEVRHAKMFRQRAREVLGTPDGRVPAPEAISRDLMPVASAAESGSLSLTDHGFLPSDNFHELGEVRYMAMLHLAEVQAAEDFQVHFDLTKGHDPGTAAVFKSILRDEEYHVAYTRAQLQEWEREGRADEVRKALRKMRWTRVKTQWVLMSQLFGDFMSRLLLGAIYFTVFLPFGVLGWLLPRGTGWLPVRRQPAPSV